MAWFSYPQDQPIDDDVKLLTEKMTAIHHDQPGLKMNPVAFSMGSLVCRGYVEGNRLHRRRGPDDSPLLAEITARPGALVCSPSARNRFSRPLNDKVAAKLVHYQRPVRSRLRSLQPDSTFLKKLNAQPRRAGVRYTVVEGMSTSSASPPTALH